MSVRFFLLCLFLCGALWTTPSAATAAPSPGKIFAVVVEAKIDTKRSAIGAGVIVDVSGPRIRVLTAKHVLLSDNINVWIGNKPYSGEVVRTFPGRDLAVIDVYASTSIGRELRAVLPATMPARGEPVEVWGEDASGLQMRRASVVDPSYVPPDETGRTLLDLACQDCIHGDSGGGVFTGDGRLVAILAARYHRGSQTVAIVAEPIDASLYADDPATP